MFRTLVLTLLAMALASSSSHATPQSVAVVSGWNAVGFQYSRLTSLTVPSQVAGAVYYDGSAYQTFNLSLENVNQGDGVRRGFWVFATGNATLVYDGSEETGAGTQLNLRSGWNLAAFPSTLTGASLTTLQNGQTVPLGSVLLTRFYENGSTPVDLPGGSLRPGRIYWIFANAPVTLRWGSAPQASPSPLGSVVETWQLSNYLVGKRAGIDSTQGSVLMPNVILRPDNTYRMYYNLARAGDHSIHYADSSNLTSFTAGGTSLVGPSDLNDREHTTGGASVLRLADGRYRMYYRCSPQPSPGQNPAYSLRSALSSDGATFTREGTRIDIQPFDSSSQFQLVGQGSFYELPSGGYGCIFSGNLVGDSGPADLFLTTSSDGLSWGNFKLLYNAWHDPVVTRHGGRYYMVANYLTAGCGRAISDDGVTWPAVPETIAFVNETGGTLGPADGIGDLDAISTPTGLRLFCNFGVPSVDIVSWMLR